MAIEFNMPKLGHAMEEAAILAWRKQTGNRVEKGEVLLEIETDKATLEVESTVSGVLAMILVEPGQTVSVGTPPGPDRGEYSINSKLLSGYWTISAKPSTTGVVRCTGRRLTIPTASSSGQLRISSMGCPGPNGRIAKKWIGPSPATIGVAAGKP